MNAPVMGPPPLPIPDEKALAYARLLRERYRFSYSVIARVMALYHGQYYSEYTWRHRLRAAGSPAKPHGTGGGGRGGRS